MALTIQVELEESIFIVLNRHPSGSNRDASSSWGTIQQQQTIQEERPTTTSRRRRRRPSIHSVPDRSAGSSRGRSALRFACPRLSLCNGEGEATRATQRGSAAALQVLPGPGLLSGSVGTSPAAFVRLSVRGRRLRADPSGGRSSRTFRRREASRSYHWSRRSWKAKIGVLAQHLSVATASGKFRPSAPSRVCTPPLRKELT